ncbi:toxic anion resistance protein [Sphingomonas sp.]|uniref:toxic anion resistance protein n=1 Tax=Sphingomonas sp. TaxID=28214 RepID=UPI0031D1E2C9
MSGDPALDETSVARIRATARELAGAFVAVPAHSPEFDGMADRIAAIGSREAARLADHANRAAPSGTEREAAMASIHAHLGALRLLLRRLDPGDDDPFRPRGFLGRRRASDQVASYFDRYRAAESEIAAALTAMKTGRDILLQDNIRIEGVRAAGAPLFAGLGEAVLLCAALGERLEKLVKDLGPSDPAKAQRLQSEVLVPVRRQHADLTTQMAVSRQGEAMLAMIQRQNLDLAKGIDQTLTVLIAALRTAVAAASALGDQRAILERIGGLRGGSVLADQPPPHEGTTAAEQAAALRAALAKVAAHVDSIAPPRVSRLS